MVSTSVEYFGWEKIQCGGNGEKLHWREINFNHCEEALSEHSCLKAQRKTYIRKKTCECYQCANAFIKNCALDLHKQTHSGENAPEYNQCETAFKQNLHLVHKKTYTQENPINALTVRKAYLLPRTLGNVFFHGGERTYAFKERRKALSHSTNLFVHMRTH